MKRFVCTGLVVALAVLGVACGDDGDGGAGGTSSTSASSGSTKTASSGSGSGSTSGSQTASSTTTATGTATATTDASSSTGVMCRDVACANDCIDGFWPEIDTCPSCACEALLSFSRGGAPHDAQFVTLATKAAPFIGAIDRWELDFTWTFDIPQGADDMEVVVARVRIPVQDLMTEPGAMNEMRLYEGVDFDGFEVTNGKWTLHGFALIEEDLSPAGGFISIRRNGQTFEGYTSLDLQSVQNQTKYTVSGPFSVPVPPI